MSRNEQVVPKHLSVSTKAWWKSVTASYTMEPHHFHLLQLCCEARDMAEEARKILAKEGLTIRDRFGVPRRHPATAVLQDARLAFARLVRELGINKNEKRPVGRPQGY